MVNFAVRFISLQIFLEMKEIVKANIFNVIKFKASETFLRRCVKMKL